jgi:hypothetical protein
LLEVGVDRAVDPGQHGAVHLHPCRSIGVDDVEEDMVGEGVLAQDGEEHGAPPVVVIGGAIQNQGHEDLDVEDGDGCGVDGGVLGLVRVEGRRPIGLRLACRLGRVFACLVLLAGLALSVGLGHVGDEGRS